MRAGQALQEFMGFQFDIASSPRRRHPNLSFSESGFLTFTYPARFPNKLENTKLYIQKNQSYLAKCRQRILRKVQENQAALQDYLSSHPAHLLVFDKPREVSSLSIGILSGLLYERGYSMICTLARLMGLEFKSLKVSYAKSYLGQCNRGHIKIDYRTVLCSENLLRYLLVHELSHLRHPNHSKSFWREVEQYHPNCREARSQLKAMVVRNTEILRHYDLLPNTLK